MNDDEFHVIVAITKNYQKGHVMELKDFVSVTIKQLIDGVVEAQGYAAEKGALVNPSVVLTFGDSKGVVTDRHGNSGQLIEFDVALTTTEGDQYKGGLGIFVGPVGVGTQGQADFQNSTVSRIKFVLPVFLPKQSL